MGGEISREISIGSENCIIKPMSIISSFLGFELAFFQQESNLRMLSHTARGGV